MGAYWMAGRGIVKPCRAVTERHRDIWTAEQPDTGIWGEGRTEAGAVEDLRVALAAHRDILMNSTALSPHLGYQRRWLNEHLAAS